MLVGQVAAEAKFRAVAKADQLLDFQPKNFEIVVVVETCQRIVWGLLEK
jgi:hypothetical protein